MNKAALPRRADEHGVPDPFPHMHPLLKQNYGNWDWHDRPRPGVLHHVAKSGDEVWTVRAGTHCPHFITALGDVVQNAGTRPVMPVPIAVVLFQ